MAAAIKLAPDRTIAYASALVLAALVAAVCFLRPGSTPYLPPCPLYFLTGLYCPGCGSTRMLYFLVHGHPYLAFRENPLSMLVLPGAIYGLGRQMFARPRAVQGRAYSGWILAFGVVVILFGVLRNIPYAPFTALAPGGEIRERGPVKAGAFAGQAGNFTEIKPPAPSL